MHKADAECLGENTQEQVPLKSCLAAGLLAVIQL